MQLKMTIQFRIDFIFIVPILNEIGIYFSLLATEYISIF